jgi:hypothetical protein
METKEISVIVTYRGQIPANADMVDVREQIEGSLDDSFRLSFTEKDDEEYDEDTHEPYFDQRNVIIAEDGYSIQT